MNGGGGSGDKKLESAKTRGIWELCVNFIKEDIKKKPRSFKIGFFTVFLVVSFLLLVVFLCNALQALRYHPKNLLEDRRLLQAVRIILVWSLERGEVRKL